MNKKFNIIGAPFNYVGHVNTEKNTVEDLRKSDEITWNGLTEWINVRNSRWSCDIQDKGDVLPSNRVLNLLHNDSKDEALSLYCSELKERVKSSFKESRTPIIIGGDHSVTIGTLSAALEYFKKERKEKIAVVWIDAHADCNNSIHSNLHGKPLAILMDEYKHNGWSMEKEIKLSPKDLFYVAVRDLMPNEFELINKYGVSNYSMEAIDNLGFNSVLKELLQELENKYDRFFVSFDYDSLDGSIFRACATPNVGGLSAREAISLISRLSASNKFIGIDFMEYLPELDKTGISKELMIKLVDAVWGYRS